MKEALRQLHSKARSEALQLAEELRRERRARAHWEGVSRSLADRLTKSLEEVKVLKAKLEKSEQALSNLPDHSRQPKAQQSGKTVRNNLHRLSQYGATSSPLSTKDEWRQAFKKFRQSDDVTGAEKGQHLPLQVLGQVLSLLGLQAPQENWVNEVLQAMPPSKKGKLKQEEFFGFMRGYLVHQRRSYMKTFKDFDVDGSDSLSRAEFARLTVDLALNLPPGVADEVFNETDTDGNGVMNSEEFVETMSLLTERQGFAKKDVQELDLVFKKFDRDQSGLIDGEEIGELLKWLGYKPSARILQEVTNSFDVDGDLRISKLEFLMIMRKYREVDLSNAGALFGNCDADFSGSVDKSELRGLFMELGFVLVDELVDELWLELAPEDSGKQELLFEEFWKLMRIHREREGFLLAEIEEQKQAFFRYHEGEANQPANQRMNAVELGRALRWVGYHTTLTRQHLLVKAVDVDDTGKLKFREFQKCVRVCREQEIELIRKAFLSTDRVDSETISNFILEVFGRIALKEELEICLEDLGNEEGYDFCDVYHVIHNFRKLDASNRHNNAGFTDPEVAQLQQKFHLNEDPNTHRVQCSRARHLMEMLLPKNTKVSKQELQVLEEVIREAEHDENGSIEFGDFLQFAKTVKDARDAKQFRKLQKQHQQEQKDLEELRNEFNISDEQLHDYREVFKKFDIDGSGELSLGEVLQMIKHVRDLNIQQEVTVMKVLKELDEDGSGQTNFVEFVRVLNKLQVEGILSDGQYREAPRSSIVMERIERSASSSSPSEHRQSVA